MLLSLVDPVIGIQYQKIQFPDGQQDIRILDYQLVQENIENKISDTFTIESRLNSFLDLELIICAIQAIKKLGITKIKLFIPYVLGARSDRQFVEGGSIYFKDVIAPILDSLNLEEIIVLDIHNPLAAMYAFKTKIIIQDNSKLVNFALGDINSNKVCIISPDEGAGKKIYSLCKKINFKGELVTCSKKRDLATGEITSLEMGNIVDFKGSDIVIVDDICDGGRTFLEIAKKVKLLNPGNLYLIVTHGIFSKGFEELSEYFTKIYTTNSVKNIDNKLVKQLNIF